MTVLRVVVAYTSAALLALLALAVLALVVWFLIASAGILLKLAGAVAIVVVASRAYQQLRGD